MSKHSDAFKTQLDGFVVLFNDSYRGSGIAVGGYDGDPVRLARRNPTGAIVNVERARQVAREYHDWDIPSEDELRQAAMADR
jgi:hypothetical protein